MKLYFAKRTVSIAVAIGLQESGLDWTAQRVDFGSAEQTKPEFRAINPKARVPALQLSDGTVLTETGALLDYIAACAPQKGLVPSDPEPAAHVRSVMYYLASTMHVNHAHRGRGTRWADQASSHEDMAAKVPQTMAASAAYVEDECLRGTYVLGETFSIADAYLFVVCSWLEGDGVPLDGLPGITAFMKAMDARDSVKFCRAEDML
ncbi:glutathione S-transferase [Sulfitobacter sp. SK012]|uniref:glutathione S-transferase family protein n=1 Tax=Sulfitobacter sp. SK012 TaxID=1389005 RepID=UPI000E0C15ED|nr:glutathione S-transferase family protein [Sulfitobacter sp. SK012]AXI48235.1 glutathione S-transferase [Sulfitobacter sp. SK012]